MTAADVGPKTGALGTAAVVDPLRVPRVSIVMPCLNEERAIASCITKARAALDRYGLDGEVVVADNGSTDRSAEIAASLGARVTTERRRGYGSAYLSGIAAAQGEYIVLVDADDTYDFDALDRFVAALDEGYEYVNGDRFGGEIMPGAMPWSNRYIGNPVLSGLLNLLFRTGIRDVHCGMRAFTRDAYERMKVTTTGMEFASEMVIHAARAELRRTEVPIRYYPRTGDTKLHRVRDGWRHLRLILLYSPTALFLVPGLALFIPGLVLMLLLTPGPLRAGGLVLDLHTMIACSGAVVVGLQVISLGLFAEAYSASHRLGSSHGAIAWLNRNASLEMGALLGIGITVVGVVADLFLVVQRLKANFDAFYEIRLTVLALTLTVVGIQLVFASFFMAVMLGPAWERERD
ncbi:MAG: hypothetical protein QOE92_2356 [Chloroflexota bacterium]|jgi:glycosyltransferase involved in cell wall biosynthesis|nr:hypothetical protein [Chloroflexota bacterium]